jgi:hypothetical protein
MKWLKHRRFRRDYVPTMGHEDTVYMLRTLVRLGSTDRRTMLALANRAIESDQGENPGERRAITMYRDAIAAGRRIGVKTFPATFNTVTVPDDLREAVEDALNLNGDTP